MSEPNRVTEKINDTTTITKCSDGFWLYDKLRGMNLAMRAGSEKDALISALEYYQVRFSQALDQIRDAKKREEAILEVLGAEIQEE